MNLLSRNLILVHRLGLEAGLESSGPECVGMSIGKQQQSMVPFAGDKNEHNIWGVQCGSF